MLSVTLRYFVVRPWRTLIVTAGFGLGVAVMIVLLSVGQAMLTQAEDRALIGGGDVIVLPLGIDVEAIRTGGLAGMFFRLDRARFLTRQLLGGGRYPQVAAVAPLVEGRLLYLEQGDTLIPIRATGEVPSRSALAGAAPVILAGTWLDSPADSAYVAPSAEAFYHEIDRFHPPMADSTWAEWHYFNVTVNEDEWWYITYMIAGQVDEDRGGGRLLLTRRDQEGHRSFVTEVPPSQVTYDTASADVSLGPNTVRQRGGVYTLRARTADVALDLTVTPLPSRHFPPLAIGGDGFVSGYVVPALTATAEGTICPTERRCLALEGAPAYHDHNWGVWQDVTWEWGAATAAGDRHALLYGGVRRGPSTGGRGNAPFFLALYDGDGLAQIYRFDRIAYRWNADSSAVEGFELRARQQGDHLRLTVDVTDLNRTATGPDGRGATFFQMRGDFRVEGTVAGLPFADTGRGFFETWRTATPGSPEVPE
jgi:hypothetical protein